jgi:hypothetical protein
MVRWELKRGFAAFLVALFCVIGLSAGASRQCTSSFDPMMALTVLVINSIDGILEIMAMIVGVPAFLVASIPIGVSGTKRGLILGMLIVVMGVLALLAIPGLYRADAALVFGGVMIGLVLRNTENFRRFWPLGGTLLGLVLAVIVFATSRYSSGACVP